MLLAINANNTNIKFSVFDGNTQLSEWRIHTTNSRTADEYAVWLVHLMALKNLGPGDITAAVIGSVVPQTMFDLRLLCERYFNARPIVIGDEGVDTGIVIHMDRPRDVGADRICNAIAVREIHNGPAIVVDFGTATTFDVVDQTGAYIGGVIAPGINLSIEALHTATAKLPRITVERPARVIGKDTLSAMHAGVFWGYVGLIEGLVARIKAEFGAPMKVFATGGQAPLFVDATDVIEEVAPDLSMRGLLAVYRRNAGEIPTRRIAS
ncbi:type III pantothenate kinase [Zavarzinia sp. CC-PAN008]|uniref:type III pantothenate kinase n=1 Tax=Zavarzinia sp. CC-PAN008 TaxID=3243332 RepID=UPI003F743F5B